LENTLTYALFGIAVILPVVRHLRRTQRKEAAALEATRRSGLTSEGPRAQHPRIDVSHCIGCGACTDVCPEGDVLGMVGGKAAIINPQKCIGHGVCAEACPVGAIEIVMASPSIRADLPRLTAEHETTVPNLFIVGELGGLALIKNAVNQGRDVIDTIARRFLKGGLAGPEGERAYDVCIVGAGPGGISASLRAVERKLSYLTLEQDEVGGTVAKYPRQKLVMTSPVEFPLHGPFRKLELSKEELLKFWHGAVQKAGLRVNAKERVEEITRGAGGRFRITTAKGSYAARAVILALGRRGTPRTLGVPGEELPKVMYSLIDAEAYRDASILVVGGGDSAVEAAMGLAHQKGNRVSLSYRGPAFHRIKDRNQRHLQEAVASGKLRVLFNSEVVEVRDRTVELQVGEARQELKNDYVWVLVGGTPPAAFLQKIGIQTGPHDLTAEAAREARLAAS
jgi:thioredoxin reductase (NADPH)